jgi:hypothetical protein
MSRVAIDAGQIKGVSRLRVVELCNGQGIAGDMLELAGITAGENREPIRVSIGLDFT